MKGFLRISALLICSVALMGVSCEGFGKRAQVRLLNVSTGYEALDLYANEDDDDEDSRELEAVAFETVSDYAELSSGTYTIKLKKNGVSSTLQTLSSETLDDDSQITYVAYGSTGNFSSLTIDEGEDEPDKGEVKVRVLNTAESGDLDIYLTDDSASLDDSEPTFSSVEFGKAADITTIDSGTYRLRVTGAGDTDDLRLDVSGVVLGSEQVVSLVITATAGGVLVNAAALPQDGKLSLYKNTMARVRGAVGVANSSSVTASVAGVTLFSNAGAGVIGSTYQQVDAGAAAISLSVDGTAVSVDSPTLTAGSDYTLFVWDDASGTHTTLVSDDNHLPETDGQAKVHVLNGASGLGEPISVAIDYSPIIEGLELGAASSYEEVDSGSNYRIDITNTNTSDSLQVREDDTLNSDTVYTLLVFGGGDAAVSSTLRKDR